MPISHTNARGDARFHETRLAFALKFLALMRHVFKGVSRVELENLGHTFFPHVVVTEKEKSSPLFTSWLLLTKFDHPETTIVLTVPSKRVPLVEPQGNVLAAASPYGDSYEGSFIDGMEDPSVYIDVKTDNARWRFLPFQCQRKWMLTRQDVLDFFSCPDGEAMERAICDQLVREKRVPSPAVQASLKSILGDEPSADRVEWVMDLFETLALQKIEKGDWDPRYSIFMESHLKMAKQKSASHLEMRALKNPPDHPSPSSVMPTRGAPLIAILKAKALSAKEATLRDFYQTCLRGVDDLEALRHDSDWNGAFEDVVLLLKCLGLPDDQIRLVGVGLMVAASNYSTLSQEAASDRQVLEDIFQLSAL